MSAIRPLGHIACNLQVLAVTILYRLRRLPHAKPHACWVDDDGCVYLAPVAHHRATAVRRHAPEQAVNTYAKARGVPFPLTSTDILADLQEARVAHAARSLYHAEADAA